ncbi:hypothetical protein BLX24_21615 [Arsenicibacter rosenii]|uniref:DUF6876 domain-containing protein n=1 Tax=Arsenicibacter rosenii TaxID=1750698 RepID=A0A1S2VEN0_9BACT|nr:hypothetical protein BLX24_21615 [Arsenicibacter rosenii]
MTPAEKADHLTKELRRFTGTVTWFRHILFPKYLYTEGVRFLAEEAEAYWLIEMIFAFQTKPVIRNAGYFQAWDLIVHDNKTATLTCENGNCDLVFTHHLTFTDFPLPKVKMFFIHDTLLLTSEY